MEIKYKIYSLETNSALYGIVHQGERDQSKPMVVCEVDLGYDKQKELDDLSSAMVFIKENKLDLLGEQLVVLATIKIAPYFND